MSHTDSHTPANNKLEKWTPRIDLCSGTGQEHDDEVMSAGIAQNLHRVERLLVKSIVVTLDKIKHKDRFSATDELKSLLRKSHVLIFVW